MPSNPIIREIPRAKLMEVFKTPELVKLFEGVLFNISTTIPTGIEDVTGIADAAQATATSAQENLNAHITDTTDAHDASAISVVPVGAIVATDVQAALAGLDAILALRGTLYTQNASAVAITGGTVLLASGALGYAAGNGGTVTQATNKGTGVTLDKPSGEITMNAAGLAAGAAVSFTLTNSTIAPGDRLILNHVSGGSFMAYDFGHQCGAGAALIGVRNVTAGVLSEAIVLGFTVIKSANS